MMRSAISPRLAMRIFLNGGTAGRGIERPTLKGPTLAGPALLGGLLMPS
jgi:hypothetical protein